VQLQGVVIRASSQRQVKVNGGELDKQGKHLSGRLRQMIEWWVFKAITSGQRDANAAARGRNAAL
jgi:hypothetical protein